MIVRSSRCQNKFTSFLFYNKKDAYCLFQPYISIVALENFRKLDLFLKVFWQFRSFDSFFCPFGMSSLIHVERHIVCIENLMNTDKWKSYTVIPQIVQILVQKFLILLKIFFRRLMHKIPILLCILSNRSL